jgi:hypothetical protein
MRTVMNLFMMGLHGDTSSGALIHRTVRHHE